MKFTINKTSFLKTLQPLSKAIPARSTLPVLGCALFTQKNNKLNIRTTDLEISISIDSIVENGEDGSIAIPLNKLLEITSAIPEGNIDFLISDVGKVNIECKQGKYTIMGQPHDDFSCRI